MLTDEELEMLSENIEHVSFDKGETIFREGVLNAHIDHVFFMPKLVFRANLHMQRIIAFRDNEGPFAKSLFDSNQRRASFFH